MAEEVRRHTSKLNESRGIWPMYRDVTELHAGAELKLSSISLRAGWWRDPSRIDSPQRVARPDVMHRTFGAGIDLGRARLDLAYDDGEPFQRRAVAGLTFGL